MSRSDEELVAGYLAGDDACFALLIQRYQGPLMRFLRTRLGDDFHVSEPVDLGQGANQPTYDPDELIPAWRRT